MNFPAKRKTRNSELSNYSNGEAVTEIEEYSSTLKKKNASAMYRSDKNGITTNKKKKAQAGFIQNDSSIFDRITKFQELTQQDKKRMYYQ